MEEFRPDLSFEYDYIRIVYEVILGNLRTNKKIMEKEITTIITKIQNLKKKEQNNTKCLQMINNLLSKLDEVEKKVNALFSFKYSINQLNSGKKLKKKRKPCIIA